MPRLPPPKNGQFLPGQSGNPAGKPKGLLTRDQVEALMGRMARLTRDELQKVVQDPKSSMLDIMVASIMAKAAKDGDYARLQFLLDRTIGKTRDESSLTIRPENPFDAFTNDELIAAVRSIPKQIEGPK